MLKNNQVSRYLSKKIVKRIVLIFVCMVGSLNDSFAQQNIQFSQYFFNTLSVNPAYAGYKEAWYLQAGHRMQWIAMDGAPVTTQVSVDGVTDDISKKVGLGLQITADKLGVQSATSIYANYAYRIQLDDEDLSRLSLGLGVGMTQYGLDGTKLDPVTVNDPLLNYDHRYNYIPDIRFGIYYYNPRWYLGFSAMDLLSGSRSSTLFNWKIDNTMNVMRKTHCYIISGALFDLTEYTKFRPSLNIREDFVGPTNLDLSAVFIFENRFWGGLSYRTGIALWNKDYDNGLDLTKRDAISGIFQFQATERLRVGYSYDLATNGLASALHGTHELSVGWVIPGKHKRVLSPRFF